MVLGGGEDRPGGEARVATQAAEIDASGLDHVYEPEANVGHMSRTSPRMYAVWTTMVVSVLGAAYVLSYPLALMMCTTGRFPPEIRAYAPVESVIFRSEVAFNAMNDWSYVVGDDRGLVWLRLAMHQWHMDASNGTEQNDKGGPGVSTELRSCERTIEIWKRRDSTRSIVWSISCRTIGSTSCRRGIITDPADIRPHPRGGGPEVRLSSSGPAPALAGIAHSSM